MRHQQTAASLICARSFETRDFVSGHPDDVIELDYEQRRRRRIVFETACGLRFLLDLPKAGCLRQGDRLILEDGRRIEVRAAKESLAEIRGRSPHHLTMLAYHLGNRHLEAQILEGRILVRPDHVIENMVRGLGGQVQLVFEAFEPEAGAYHSHSERHPPDHHAHEPDNV